MIGRVFRHLTMGGGMKNSEVKVIKLNQGIGLIKSNQGMGLIRSNQDIQS